MKKAIVSAVLLLLCCLCPLSVKAENSAGTTDMYRLYNPNSGEHFYTGSAAERDHLITVGWHDEGIGWGAPKKSDTPVYRLYNANAGDHHYTSSEAEKDMLVAVGWSYEGIGWYSDDEKRIPLYRQYNPNAKAGSHNYTTSKAENDYLASIGWRAEGIGWYGITGAVPAEAPETAETSFVKVEMPREWQGKVTFEYAEDNPERFGMYYEGYCIGMFFLDSMEDIRGDVYITWWEPYNETQDVMLNVGSLYYILNSGAATEEEKEGLLQITTGGTYQGTTGKIDWNQLYSCVDEHYKKVLVPHITVKK